DKCTAIMAGKSFHTVLNVVKMPVININLQISQKQVSPFQYKIFFLNTSRLFEDILLLSREFQSEMALYKTS
ncbi:MAG: hypothetical protein K2P53_00005, partial [Rickettsiales bacterium]|nr:hypothetical protein [Rickettsiales bacterium]